MSVSTTVKINGGVSVSVEESGDLSKKKRSNFAMDLAKSFGVGSALDECDVAWADERTLAATSEELDLAGGLTDDFGSAFSFAKVKVVAIRNLATTAGHVLEVGGAASNAFLLLKAANDVDQIGPDGRRLFVEPSLAGKAVTASTADKLKIDSGANTITYQILIAGVKA